MMPRQKLNRAVQTANRDSETEGLIGVGDFRLHGHNIKL